MDETTRSRRDARFTTLPPPVRLAETVEVTEPDPVPDPEAGRDTDRDFLLRYLG